MGEFDDGFETVIEERGDFRVRVEVDYQPTEPYHDGGSPLLKFGYNRWDRYEAEQVTSITSYVVDPAIVRALDRWGDDRNGPRETPHFERYLRMFHGTREMVWSGGFEGARYVTFDTAHWREAMELTDEWLAEMTEGRAEPLRLVDMDEYQAYLNGECYVWIVEQKAEWIKVGSDERREEWEEVEAIGGYYDREYVEAEAREALESYAGESEAA
ncbi:hypothetical protein [Kribbella sindirgiensis]|uniref:Uncharacterized protein n=1 Tax=Kribbella sindirgiensis TaxID=1124744 RepID=A0A4R0I064_9ACTN|nr:hypothetical protein [Kribbella sindirgiensis]TCC19940.1 hypothetical protein E0H50_37555 [Kribbella sindirgiensis]